MHAYLYICLVQQIMPYFHTTGDTWHELRRKDRCLLAAQKILIKRTTMQIGRRRRAHQEKHPDAKIISLGIGDTTEPIPKSIADAMQKAAAGMATLEGYSG